jgi:hypothetical protein
MRCHFRRALVRPGTRGLHRTARQLAAVRFRMGDIPPP